MGHAGGGGGIVEIDVGTRTTATWHEQDCYPGEGVFVGRPEREA